MILFIALFNNLQYLEFCDLVQCTCFSMEDLCCMIQKLAQIYPRGLEFHDDQPISSLELGGMLHWLAPPM